MSTENTENTENNESEKLKIFTIRTIPLPLHTRFRIAAAYTGKTMEEIAVDAIDKEVTRIHEYYNKLVSGSMSAPGNVQNVEKVEEPVNVNGTESVE